MDVKIVRRQGRGRGSFPNAAINIQACDDTRNYRIRAALSARADSPPMWKARKKEEKKKKKREERKCYRRM